MIANLKLAIFCYVLFGLIALAVVLIAACWRHGVAWFVEQHDQQEDERALLVKASENWQLVNTYLAGLP